VNVTGAVFRLAQGSAAPTPIGFANARVGDVRTQALTITNTAAADGFSEHLNAAFSASSGAASSSGSVALLTAGSSNNTNMSVALDTSAAGARVGTVTVAFQSDGTGTTGGAPISVGTQTLNVSGNVYQTAVGQLNTTSLNFGTVQVGQSVSQALSVSNVAAGPTGFVEDLNARFGAATGLGANLITGGGQISGLAAGGTDTTTMSVSVNTSAAGAVNGAIPVNFFSSGGVGGVSNGLAEIGVGSANFGVVGTIQAVGQVINQAAPVINTPALTVALGNVRVGAASPVGTVSVTNQATTAPQAALNASISAAPPLTAAGSFNLLLPGQTDNTSLTVGMTTATAGSRNGTATVNFVSDASNVGGCEPNCQLPLPSQNVNVTGGVFQLAQPAFGSTTISGLAARVGGTAQQALSLTNTNVAPAGFQEGLAASIGGASAGISASGSIANLAAGVTNNTSLLVGLDTSSAGARSGTASVALTSTGAGTSGLGDLALSSQTINVSGNVYTPAVAQLNTNAIDFGIVRVGDVVGARNVSVTNAAAVAPPNDTLAASFGVVASPFAGSGSAAGLGAGQSNSPGSMTVGLSTAAAGVFNGTAAVDFLSQNPDMADLALGSESILLSAQVNNLANPAFGFVSGAGSLGLSGSLYVLDLGTIVLGTTLTNELRFVNDALAPADAPAPADVADMRMIAEAARSGGARRAPSRAHSRAGRRADHLLHRQRGAQATGGPCRCGRAGRGRSRGDRVEDLLPPTSTAPIGW
jgi:hypothetical protein